MRILVENYKVECFENEQDYKSWIGENNQAISRPSYHGAFYGIPKEVKALFKDNLLVSIKTLCYTDTKFIIIHK